MLHKLFLSALSLLVCTTAYAQLTHLSSSELKNFKHQPEEIETFESIFQRVLTAKKINLLKGYVVNSEAIINDFSERVYAVANDQCSLTDLFVGEVFRTQINNIVQDMLKFNCNEDIDGVVLFRVGEDLEPLPSADLLHLKANRLIEQGVLNLKPDEYLDLTVLPEDLTLRFKQSSETKKELVIVKKFESSLKVIIEYKQFISWSDSHQLWDHWWDINIFFGIQEPYQQIRFLTVTQQNKFYPNIYKHVRYFNGCSIDPVKFTDYFDQFNQLLEAVLTGGKLGMLSIPTMTTPIPCQPQ